jgi:CheY-like chemotaxis protein
MVTIRQHGHKPEMPLLTHFAGPPGVGKTKGATLITESRRHSQVSCFSSSSRNREMQELPTIDPMSQNPDPVLVVEDNGLNQKVALLLLERLGMAAEVAKNGLEALEAVKQKHYSIILMDCHMPEMDGFEATVAIRKLEETSGTYTPIIAVTALTTPRDRQLCLEAGMDDYIPKPIEKDLLKVKIDQWLLTALALHNPGSAAIYRSSIVASQQAELGEEVLNFKELEEFYGECQLSKMLQAFMADSEEKIDHLETLIKVRNVTAVSLLAREIKASCAAIGAKQLAKLCLYLQLAASKADWIEAQETLTSMQRAFCHARYFFQAGVVTEENSPIDDCDLESAQPLNPSLQESQGISPPPCPRNNMEESGNHGMLGVLGKA